MFNAYDDLDHILFTREQIAARVKELGAEISRDYEDKNPVVVCVLKGAVIFYADLVRELTLDCEFDFLKVSSYGKGSSTSGEVKMLKDLDVSIQGRHVLIVEDILDTGITLSYLMRVLQVREPASIKLCTFLNKKEKRRTAITADYVGFEVPDEFVVGYGLDFAQRYRMLGDVGVLKKEMYQ